MSEILMYQAEIRSASPSRALHIIAFFILFVLLSAACIPKTAESPAPTESPQETEGKVYEFAEIGVKVTIPTQKNLRDVVLEEIPLEGVPAMDAEEEYFKLGRLVINFVLHESGNPEELISEFDPPIELQINYTRADEEFADVGEKELGFAFWDGEKWIRFTEEKHQFARYPLDDQRWAGYGLAIIQNLGDPTIAIGR